MSSMPKKHLGTDVDSFLEEVRLQKAYLILKVGRE